jgi:hypothetical protein
LVQSTLAFLLSTYIGVTLSTMRWRFENRAVADTAVAQPGGVIGCFWHGAHRARGRLPPSAEDQAPPGIDIAVGRWRIYRRGGEAAGVSGHPRLSRKPGRPLAKGWPGDICAGLAVHR